MSLPLSKDLAATRRDILRMGTLVGHVVHASLALLEEAAEDERVIAEETEINRIDVNVEESCLKMLALHQPVAGDLRQVAAMLKISTELERIADLAQNITERASALRRLPAIGVPAKLISMAHAAMDMVDRALIAYTEQKLVMAQQICGEDDAVDQLNREIIDELTELMRTSPDLIEPALHLFSVSRHVERIGDHATNIAEDVIYLIEGEIVRHRESLAGHRQSA
jgi:phosphate transport system protein